MSFCHFCHESREPAQPCRGSLDYDVEFRGERAGLQPVGRFQADDEAFTLTRIADAVEETVSLVPRLAE